MNQAGNKKLKKLFQECGEADERLAPPFAKVWGAALSQVNKKQASWPRYAFQLATVMILLIALGIAIGKIVWHADNQAGDKLLTASATMVNLVLDLPKVSQPTPIAVRQLAKAEKPVIMLRRQHAPRYKPVAVALSQWHSPTDFLLQSSNEQLLKTTPKLSELPKIINLDIAE